MPLNSSLPVLIEPSHLDHEDDYHLPELPSLSLEESQSTDEGNCVNTEISLNNTKGRRSSSLQEQLQQPNSTPASPNQNDPPSSPASGHIIHSPTPSRPSRLLSPNADAAVFADFGSMEEAAHDEDDFGHEDSVSFGYHRHHHQPHHTAAVGLGHKPSQPASHNRGHAQNSFRRNGQHRRAVSDMSSSLLSPFNTIPPTNSLNTHIDETRATDNNNPGFTTSPSSISASLSPSSAMSQKRNPFNFQTQVLDTTPIRTSGIGQRKGHRYKHSSISTQHQIFQEPPSRPPPVLPASLPIPTVWEAKDSMSRDQRVRMYWCLCHVAVAVWVFYEAQGSLAMMALSHLVFFDAGCAAICVMVDVLGNFEVWRRSSIRHPFGLQRVEVLAGFAMSVFLLFGGFDLISHNIKDLMNSSPSLAAMDPPQVHSHHPAHEEKLAPENIPPHSPSHPGHSHHHHAIPVDPGFLQDSLDWAGLSAMLVTLISAYGLRNHARISKVMRVSYLSSVPLLPRLLSNPFHALTLSSSIGVLLLPWMALPENYHRWLDRVICAAISASMFILGFRLAIAQGLMLLMSFGNPASSTSSSSSASTTRDYLSKSSPLLRWPSTTDPRVLSVVEEIESETVIDKLEFIHLWQIHYGLGMANISLRVTRDADENALAKLRTRIAALIQNRLGEGYGTGGSLRWEVTVQMSSDR